MEAIGPHICPDCGERVSAFAAGCALCGAELDPKRAADPPTLRERIAYRLAIARLRRERRPPRRDRGLPG